MILTRKIEWKRLDTAILIGVGIWTMLLIVLPPFDTIFFRADMTYFSAFEYAVRDAISSGQLPLWNRFFSEPLLGNSQAMVLYPPSMLLRFLPITTFMVVFGWFHIFLLFISLYILLRHWDFSRLATVAGAGLVSFSSFVFVRLIIGHIVLLPVYGWSIFSLLFFARLLHYGRFRDFIFTLVATSMVILSGHTQYSLIGLLISGSYALFYLQQQKSLESLFRIMKYSTLLGVSLAGLLSVQLIPNAEFFLHTSRIGGISLKQATVGQLTPLTSLNFLFSYGVYNFDPKVNIQETLFFSSVMMPGIFLLACFRAPRKFRTLIIYSMFLAIPAVILAVGSYTPFYRIIVYDVLPMFRAPGRFLLWLIVPLALFTAVTIEWLQESSTYYRNTVIVMSLIMLELVLYALFLVRNDFDSSFRALTPLILSILLWTFVIVLRLRLSKLTWTRLFVLVLLLDSSLHSMNLGLSIPGFPSNSDVIFDETKFLCLSQYIDETSVRLGQDQSKSFYERMVDLNDLRTAASFGIPVYQSHLSNISWAGDLWDNAPNLLQADYMIGRKTLGDEWQKVDTGCQLDLYKHRNINQSRVYAADQIIWVADNQTLSAVSDDEFDPTQSVVISEEESAEQDILLAENELIYTAEITNYTANQISIKSNITTDAILVIADLYYPGWTAYVDGVSTPVMSVNHGLRGIRLDAGSHEISMIFSPSTFYIGLGISLTSILLLLIAYFLSRIRKVELPR